MFWWGETLSSRDSISLEKVRARRSLALPAWNEMDAQLLMTLCIAEYESYVNAVDMVSVLEAKARVWLANHGAF